jgi:hypothetical protein
MPTILDWPERIYTLTGFSAAVADDDGVTKVNTSGLANTKQQRSKFMAIPFGVVGR